MEKWRHSRFLKSPPRAVLANSGGMRLPGSIEFEFDFGDRHCCQPVPALGGGVSGLLADALPWAGDSRLAATAKAVTITRVQVQAKTAPAGCTTNAIVRLTDGTTPVNVTVSAAANDSGAISQNYAAGASLIVSVQTAAAGCTTSPADANVVTVQYRMQ